MLAPPQNILYNYLRDISRLLIAGKILLEERALGHQTPMSRIEMSNIQPTCAYWTPGFKRQPSTRIPITVPRAAPPEEPKETLFLTGVMHLNTFGITLLSSIAPQHKPRPYSRIREVNPSGQIQIPDVAERPPPEPNLM